MTEITHSLDQLFDLPSMEKAITRLSPALTIAKIQSAFDDKRMAHNYDVDEIECIMYNPALPTLEKAFLLRKAYTNSITHVVSRNLLLRSFAPLLFAKPLWFEQNKELAAKIFPHQSAFNDLFFHKQRDLVRSFLTHSLRS